MAAEFGGKVDVEVVTLKEHAGAARYRELRRLAGGHLPVPCVLLEAGLVSEGIPEQDQLRAVVRTALAEGDAAAAADFAADQRAGAAATEERA